MSQPTAQGLSVLVVDDDEDTTVLLGIVLGRQGWRTTFATNLAQAQSALAEGDFSALVTDLSLPGGSGLSLLSNGRPATLRAAVVMTGSTGEADRRESERRGFDAYVVKPFEAAELVALLVRLVGPLATALPRGSADLAQDLHPVRVEDAS